MTLLLCVINVLNKFKINSNEYILNMTGGVYEGMCHLTGLWGNYIYIHYSYIHPADNLCPFTCSLTGEALLITPEHLHLFFASPLPIMIQARLNRGNPYEIVAFAWIYARQCLPPESVTAHFWMLRGYSS